MKLSIWLKASSAIRCAFIIFSTSISVLTERSVLIIVSRVVSVDTGIFLSTPLSELYVETVILVDSTSNLLQFISLRISAICGYVLPSNLTSQLLICFSAASMYLPSVINTARFSDAIKKPSEDSNPVKYFLFSGEIIKAQVFCACSRNSFCKSLIIVTKSV